MILSIETSGTSCSIAIHRKGELLGYAAYSQDKAHSRLLTVLVQQMLGNLSTSVKALDAIAVSAGPGSYTGLRIGTSVAKGLCFASDKPLIALNTLKIMADSIKNLVAADGLLCPMLDARRMEVYSAVYRADLYELLAPTPIVLEEGSFEEFLAESKVVCFGDGAAKAKGLLEGQKNAVFLPRPVTPDAKDMGRLAYQKFETQAFEDLVYFEPDYIKSFKGVKVNKSLR
jgi:tRNA threonylcarbamoyladenosine biosynthesis protein TsaB